MPDLFTSLRDCLALSHFLFLRSCLGWLMGASPAWGLAPTPGPPFPGRPLCSLRRGGCLLTCPPRCCWAARHPGWEAPGELLPPPSALWGHRR